MLEAGSLRSAKEVVPVLMKLVSSPRHVIDVGCGVGTWLSVFLEYGVNEVIGIDGDYINQQMLRIPEKCFMPHDLTKPLSLEKKFDLVLSLEVAEHSPDKYADLFVNNLTGLGSVIVFSAAIPFQGGENHVNEQWPNYWIELFQKRDYVAIDCLRDKIWNNENVEPWYAQNIILFAQEANLNNYPYLVQEYSSSQKTIQTKIHPRLWLAAHNPHGQSLKKVIKALPFSIRNAAKHSIARMLKI
ncbi:MAG: class I SAM-dependent methyltransferase [Thioploca sp.]|nr:class I SAM-dependent methyltransferase [Thioploca sp.]